MQLQPFLWLGEGAPARLCGGSYPPWLLSTRPAVTPIFVPTSAPFLHTAGSLRWGNGTPWDVAARLTPCPTPPAVLAPGQPLGSGSDSHQHLGLALARRRAPRRGKQDFTSFAEDAINAVLGLLVAFLQLFSFQLSLLFLSFPKLAPQDAADGAHFRGGVQSCDRFVPSSPPRLWGRPGELSPHQCHCLCPSATAGRDLGKAAAVSHPRGGFTGHCPAPGSSTGTAAPENFSSPRARTAGDKDPRTLHK